MPAPYLLKCLGPAELRAPDGKVVRFRVRKHLALLVFLSVERKRGHDRDRLAEMFWPRAAQAQGRHSLANALSLLRSIFGRTAFPSSRPMVRFDPPALALDLDRLEAGEVLGADGEDPLEVDGFLRGFDLPDAPEFSLWKEREHARRLPSIHAALLTLIDHARRRGSHDEIMTRAERLLALDHLAEEGIRAKIEALALAGDRFSALRVFDEWKALLAAELGAEPSGLLEGMAGQLKKRGWEPREPVAMPAVPAEQWRDRKFVGRRREYRALYETWETTHQFRPRHRCIVGDSGVGKTTLAQRLVTAAGLEGASVSRVQCYHLEQRLPYATIGALVSGLLGRPGVAATAPSALAEIAQVVPGVKDHYPNLPPPRPSEGETARLFFAEGVMDLLIAVMDERPLLLVLDDYPVADEASLAVLHLVLRRLDRGRYMVVLTARPADEDESHQARRIREGMDRLSMEPLGLEPMPEDDTAELLEVILEGADATPRVPERRALVRASRGFPMALELLTQDWRINGAKSLALAFGAMTAEFGPDRTRDRDTYAMIAERILVTLSHSARQVLTLSALLGSRASDLSMFGLVDLSFGQTVEGISELTTKRILRSVGATLEFINELVRAHVYRQIAGPVRTALHAAIADRLLADEEGGRAVPGLEIAWHLMRAGRRVEATPRLFRGASEAKDRGAPDEAVLALESALGEIDPASQTRARVVLADLHQELGRWGESLQVLEEAGELPATLEQLAMVFRLHAEWQLGAIPRDSTSNTVATLLRVSTIDGEAVGPAYMLAARMAVGTQEQPLIRQVLDAHSALQPGHIDQSLLLTISRAILLYNLRNFDEAERLASLAEVACRENERADSAFVRVLAGKAAIHVVKGEYAATLPILAEGLRFADRLDNEALVGELSASLALTLLNLCHYREAAKAAEKAIPRLNAIRAPSYLIHAIAHGTLANALLGQSAGVGEGLDLGSDVARHAGIPVIEQDWLLSQADILWAMGKRKLAIESGTVATTGRFGDPLATGVVGKYARWVARLAILNGQATEAIARVAHWQKCLGPLDAVDRVDVASALVRLSQSAFGLAPQAASQELTKWVSALSVETAKHLHRLEVI